MRFMLIRRADHESETETSPVSSAELFTAMAQYNEELIQAGMMLGGEGLHPSRKGARVTFKGGKVTVTDGPFTETKELIAGFTLIQANSMAEALDVAKRWPPLDGDGNVAIEVRQIHEAEDLGEAFTPELREREERLRAQLEQK